MKRHLTPALSPNVAEREKPLGNFLFLAAKESVSICVHLC